MKGKFPTVYISSQVTNLVENGEAVFVFVDHVDSLLVKHLLHGLRTFHTRR